MLPYTVAFRAELPHGHCVGLHLPERDPAPPPAARALLHADELAAARDFGPRRQISWLGGRVAMRIALGDLGAGTGPIASDDRGAPVLPDGVVGSLSHTGRLAVALVAPRAGWHIGVDVETDERTTNDVSRHVLTASELEALAGLPDADRPREVLLRFSAKEALYKALDPSVRRFVGFKEVEAWPRGDGIGFSLSLGEGEGPFAAEGWWQARTGFLLTTARVRPRPDEDG